MTNLVRRVDGNGTFYMFGERTFNFMHSMMESWHEVQFIWFPLHVFQDVTVESYVKTRGAPPNKC